jgi:uncharacterized phage protein (TIGR02216 family)
MTFAQSASRLAGLAGWLLHWSPEMFWRSTPAELAAIFAVMQGDGAMPAPPDRQLIQTLQEMFPDGGYC